MSVILAFILVLGVWGWFGEFGLRTGHARWSKMDFLAGVYFDVDRCLLLGENKEIVFWGGFDWVGLHNFLDFCIA